MQKPEPSNEAQENHKQVSAKTVVGSGGVWVDNSFGRNELATEGKKVYAMCLVWFKLNLHSSSKTARQTAR